MRRRRPRSLDDVELTHAWREAVLEALTALEPPEELLDWCYRLADELEHRGGPRRTVWCSCSDCMARIQQDQGEDPF